MSSIDQAVLTVYFLSMLLIGLYFSRRHSDSESYILADRDLSTFHVTASSFSTFIGAGLMFALASFGYRYGVSAFTLILAAIAGFLLFLKYSSLIREKSVDKNSVTLPQMLEDHWDRRTKALASLITILLFSVAAAAQFLVAGNILHQVFGFPLKPSAAAFGILVIIYTVLGGFKSVTWSDVVQMAIIIMGIFFVLLPITIIKYSSDIISLPASYLSQFSMPVPIFFAYLLIGVFGYYGGQDLFQRIYASKGRREAKKGVTYFGIMMLALAVTSIFLGIAARAIAPNISPDLALPYLTSNSIPPGLTGLVLAAFISMANSSADSQLLTASSNILEDFIKENTDIGDSKELLTNRILVLLIGSTALTTAILVPGLQGVFNSVGSWLGILGFTVFATLKWEIKSAKAFYSLLTGFTAANIHAFTTQTFTTSALIGILSSASALASFKLYSIQKNWPKK